MQPSLECPICGVAAHLTCTRCKLVRYCNGEHQKQHWAKHKRCCKPFREEQNPELGRYLAATHDIQAKQIIFVEDPLVVGPKWFLTEHEKSATIVPCVGCYLPCRVDRHQCRNCRWPVCSAVCQHEDLECSILRLGNAPSAKSDYRHDALLVLKCLLLQRSQAERWKALLEMQTHEEERRGTELQQEAEQRIVGYLQQRFLRHLKANKKHESLLNEYESELLHRLCGIIETNYMAIELATGVELSGLFRQACMMEHACQPNCYFQFDPATHRIMVRAGCDIKKGDHLKITYTNILWGTQLRQHHLRMTKHFSCRCPRCEDPTEYGSYVSAMRCLGDVSKTCAGVQLPLEPLSDQTQWKCDTCPMLVDAGYVTEVQTHMTEEVERLLASNPTASQVELLLARLSQLLHPNHFHMFNLKHTLIQLYGHEPGLELATLSDLQLGRKQRLCEELQNVCRRLDPHSIKLAIYVSVILMEIAHTMEEQARRLPAEATTKLELARSHLLEAQEVLEKVQDSVAGKKLNDKLQQDLFDLDKLMLANSHHMQTVV
ncbi:hypothetical protein ACLKA6_006844 [Drosophila palustris]